MGSFSRSFKMKLFLLLCLPAVALSITIQHPLKKLGDLVELKPDLHPLNGSVFYRKDQPDVITVSNFHYTQPGPDAFFWVGTEVINGGFNDDNIGENAFSLAPGEIGNSNYFDPDKSILPAYDGSQKDLVLQLPAGITISDIKWICIYCRKYSQNFCQINIDEFGNGKVVEKLPEFILTREAEKEMMIEAAEAENGLL